MEDLCLAESEFRVSTWNTYMFWNKLYIWFIFQSKWFFKWTSTCLNNLSQARMCVVWVPCGKQALCPCLLCRGHWFLRCSCLSAPHTNAASASPALVTPGMSHRGRTAGDNKNMTFSNKMGSLSHALCLSATSLCWVPWVKLHVFLSHHTI